MSEATQVVKKKLPEPRPQATRTSAVRPPVDVFEDSERILLQADLPGVGQDQLDVRVEGQLLTIEGTAALATPEDMKSVYAEFRTPRYVREFTLSGDLDAERIEAKLRDGVLTVTIPKREHAKPKRISVELG